MVDRSMGVAPSQGPGAVALTTDTLPHRKKVPYEKGFSQMHWVRLMKGSATLSGQPPGTALRNDITLDEVARHATDIDGWTVLRGNVYNISPYMKFHPGGEVMLRKAIGRDCTALFNKYHAWVNAEALLSKCLIGKLAPSEPKP